MSLNITDNTGDNWACNGRQYKDIGKAQLQLHQQGEAASGSCNMKPDDVDEMTSQQIMT